MRSLVHLALASATLSSALEGTAASLPVIEVPCSANHRCFGLDPSEVRLSAGFEAPDVEWTITPLVPDDPTNWRLVGVFAGFRGPVGYGFVFPAPGPSMGAWADEFSFTDAQGRVFITTEMRLDDPSCVDGSGALAGKWICSQGDGLFQHWAFGELPSDGDPVDPLLPSLDGPISIRLETTIFGSGTPESGGFNVHGVYFDYVYAQIPEPGSGLLVALGLLGLAYRRRAGTAGSLHQ